MAGAPSADHLGLHAERAASARPGAAPERCAGVAVGARQDVAPARRQPLPVFEQPQFFGRVDQHIGVRADPEGAVQVQEGAGGKEAVAEVGLGDRAEAGDRAARWRSG